MLSKTERIVKVIGKALYDNVNIGDTLAYIPNAPASEYLLLQSGITCFVIQDKKEVLKSTSNPYGLQITVKVMPYYIANIKSRYSNGNVAITKLSCEEFDNDNYYKIEITKPNFIQRIIK